MKKRKSDFVINNEYINLIEVALKYDDIYKFKQICVELKIIKEDEELEYNDMRYRLVENIESNPEMVQLFRQISKTRKDFKKLFAFYNVENIRFFIDHREEYNLTNDEIIEMRKIFHLRYTKYEKIREIPNSMLYLILLIVIIPFCIHLIIPIFATQVSKMAVIMDDVKVIKDERERYGTDLYITYRDIKYEYYVDDIRYENEVNDIIFGLAIVDVNQKDETTKIYYYKDKPNISNLYKVNIGWYVYTSIIVIATIFVTIKYIKELKDEYSLKHLIKKDEGERL